RGVPATRVARSAAVLAGLRPLIAGREVIVVAVGRTAAALTRVGEDGEVRVRLDCPEAALEPALAAALEHNPRLRRAVDRRVQDGQRPVDLFLAAHGAGGDGPNPFRASLILRAVESGLGKGLGTLDPEHRVPLVVLTDLATLPAVRRA